MDNLHFDPAEPTDPAGKPVSARSGRAKRVITSVAASAVLLGSGAAIGIALTGGASAASSTGSSTAAASAASAPAARCAKLAQKVRANGHPRAALPLRAFCGSPLRRLAAVGGEHGQVTFRGKTSPQTVAFERGTIESVTGSAITVKAPDGTTWTWDLTAKTTIRQAGKAATQANLSNGDLVFVAGPVVSGVNDARVVRLRKAG